MIEPLANIAGLLGVSCIVLAYFLLQCGRLQSGQMLYPLLNLVGAALILLSLLVHWNLPSFVIETIWIGISLYGVANILRRRRAGRRK